MVHLSHVSSFPPEEDDHLSKEVRKIHLEAVDNDNFTTSVYGSKFAAQDLPRYEIPDGEMPREAAYRLIKDELSLDGNPMLKYAINDHTSSFGLLADTWIVSPPSSPPIWRTRPRSS
ncbi:hypothetical protein SLS64_000615 [Diaporthe eres]